VTTAAATPTVRSRAFVPLAVAAIAIVLASPLREAGLAALAFVALGAVVGPRIALDRASLRLTSLVAIVLVIAYVRASAFPRGPGLGAFGLGFALAALAVATTRLYVARPEGGDPFTVTLGIVSVFACGGARLGTVYAAIVFVHLAASLFALWASDPDRADGREVPRRVVALGALLVTTAMAIATAFGLAAPRAHGWTQRRFDQAYEARLQARVGFSNAVLVGDIAPLLGSDELVLRVRGRSVDYLRGAVLDTYDYGRWTRASVTDPTAIAVTKGTLEGEGVTEIRHARDADHVAFLPLDLRSVATPSGVLRVNEVGAARQEGGDDRVALRLRDASAAGGGAAPRALAVAPPSAADLALPPRLRAELAAMATDWTRGALTPADALAALSRRLKIEHAYERVGSPRVKGDPILDFLVHQRSGHCEYFASALALLARSLAIPTRIVTGYRVAERHALLDHWVVRENNAHAWVEAFLPDRGWTTWDPTPMVELPQNAVHDASGASALAEVLGAAWDRAEDWLAARTVGELTTAALLGLVVFVLQRRLRARTPSPAAIPAALRFGDVPRAFLELERALAKRGLVRRQGETLESWSARQPERATGEAIAIYAAERYSAGPKTPPA
jgi:transglutaminase-like putative cysteine protease